MQVAAAIQCRRGRGRRHPDGQLRPAGPEKLRLNLSLALRHDRCRAAI
jgi:hypothetical protein